MVTITDGVYSNTAFKIVFTQGDSSGSPITSYLIEIQGKDLTYHETKLYCDGSSQTVISQLSCEVEMAILLAEPYSLEQGNMIVAHVRASNSFGNGAFSDPNASGLTVQKVPSVPVNAPVLISQAETSITVQMPEIVGQDTGGSDILSYNLQYNAGGASTTYVNLIGENPSSMILTFTKGGLTPDVIYNFRYRVKNKYGWNEGGFSPILQARAAGLPSKITKLTF